MKQVGREASFAQAFTVLYNTVMETEKYSKGMSLQILETACWIEKKSLNFLTPMDFYTACEMAREIGLISEDGHLIPVART